MQMLAPARPVWEVIHRGPGSCPIRDFRHREEGRQLYIDLETRHYPLLRLSQAVYEEDMKAGLPPSIAGYRTIQALAEKLRLSGATIKAYKAQINRRIRRAAALMNAAAPALWEHRGRNGVRLRGTLLEVYLP